MNIAYLGICAISFTYWAMTFEDIECMQCSRTWYKLSNNRN